MIAYLSKEPFSIDEVGHQSVVIINNIKGPDGNEDVKVVLNPLLICDESFLHDGTEPITADEIIAVNKFIGIKVLKPLRLWRKPTRIMAVEIIELWIEQQIEQEMLIPKGA